MFDPCIKIENRTCGFSTKRHDGTYCGLVTGVDARVHTLPKCWKKMTNYERTKLRKKALWGY